MQDVQVDEEEQVLQWLGQPMQLVELVGKLPAGQDV